VDRSSVGWASVQSGHPNHAGDEEKFPFAFYELSAPPLRSLRWSSCVSRESNQTKNTAETQSTQSSEPQPRILTLVVLEPAIAGASIEPGASAPGSRRKIFAARASGRRRLSGVATLENLSPISWAWINRKPTWGSRPRLYAFAC